MSDSNSTTRAFHPLANIFPLVDGAELAALTSDIAAHGLREPITLHPDGTILDGRNRYRACLAAGSSPRFVTCDGKGSAIAFVLSLNLHRRHLNESQRAMVAARIATLQQGQRGDRSIDPSTSQPEASSLLNVSVPSVKRAREVQDSGAAELIAAVDRGDIAVSLAAKVAELPKPAQREMVQAVQQGATPSQAYRKVAHAEVERAREWPDGKFGVIYADPPWQYDNSGFTQSAAEHYPTMPTDAICALPVGDILNDDAVCFLWVTSPLLPDGLRVLSSWGFDYKACMIWIKDRAPGIGWWVQTKHEILLIGARGNLRPETKPVSVFEAGVSAHSRKPESVYTTIEEMFPRAPRVELFARMSRPGWASWGNEDVHQQ
jgi:N6-adenosine-specific RNA methylase IME4